MTVVAVAVVVSVFPVLVVALVSAVPVVASTSPAPVAVEELSAAGNCPPSPVPAPW